MLEQRFNIENIVVIYNGVDTNFFKPGIGGYFVIQDNFKHELPRFGTVGRLGKAKGTDLLYKMASEMQGTAEFFAVGPCDKELIAEIGNNKINNFHLLGSLPNSALPSFYSFIDCFVLPSLDETFPLTVLEAMSCGKPVIASNVGGIPEMIDDGINGILLESGNFALLKEAIIKIMKDEDLRNNFANEARKKIIKNFTIYNTAEELMKFYISIS